MVDCMFLQIITQIGNLEVNITETGLFDNIFFNQLRPIYACILDITVNSFSYNAGIRWTVIL